MTRPQTPFLDFTRDPNKQLRVSEIREPMKSYGGSENSGWFSFGGSSGTRPEDLHREVEKHFLLTDDVDTIRTTDRLAELEGEMKAMQRRIERGNTNLSKTEYRRYNEQRKEMGKLIEEAQKAVDKAENAHVSQVHLPEKAIMDEIREVESYATRLERSVGLSVDDVRAAVGTSPANNPIADFANATNGTVITANIHTSRGAVAMEIGKFVDENGTTVLKIEGDHARNFAKFKDHLRDFESTAMERVGDLTRKGEEIYGAARTKLDSLRGQMEEVSAGLMGAEKSIAKGAEKEGSKMMEQAAETVEKKGGKLLPALSLGAGGVLLFNGLSDDESKMNLRTALGGVLTGFGAYKLLSNPKVSAAAESAVRHI